MAVQVTAWLDRNWFTLLIALFLLGMTLDGHRRGFLRLTVSALALILTTLFARVALPSTASFLAKNTGMQAAAERYITEKIGLDTVTDRQTADSAGQDRVIENLPIPDNFKQGLRKNNTTEVWQAVGATEFQQYAADFLGRTLLNYLGFTLLSHVAPLCIPFFEFIYRTPRDSRHESNCGSRTGLGGGALFPLARLPHPESLSVYADRQRHTGAGRGKSLGVFSLSE